VYNFTSVVKVKVFIHEDNHFDDIFEATKQFSRVQSLATLILNPTELAEFKEYRYQRLMHVPLNILQIILQESQEERVSTNVSEKDANKASKDVESQKESAIKKYMEEPSNKKNTEKGLDQKKMRKEWGKFEQLINEPQGGTSQTKTFPETPKPLEKYSEKYLTTSKYIEFVPAFPSLEIVLKEEEIPPLDIFYIPKHHVVMKRQSQKRKNEHVAIILPGN